MKIVKILVLATLFALSGCAAREGVTAGENLAAQETAVREPSWAQAIDVKDNLYKVDERLFRSSQLDEGDERTLINLGVKSIVNLRFFGRDGDKDAFGKSAFKLVNTPLLSWSISPKEVAWVLHEIRTLQDSGAVLVHCYHGADRTGLIVAMYRVIYQGWSADEARREMLEGGYGFHSIWRDIKDFFTPQNEREVRAELVRLSEFGAKGRDEAVKFNRN